MMSRILTKYIPQLHSHCIRSFATNIIQPNSFRAFSSVPPLTQLSEDETMMQETGEL